MNKNSNFKIALGTSDGRILFWESDKKDPDTLVPLGCIETETRNIPVKHLHLNTEGTILVIGQESELNCPIVSCFHLNNQWNHFESIPYTCSTPHRYKGLISCMDLVECMNFL